MQVTKLPSQDRLTELLEYHPETGEVIWKARFSKPSDSRWNSKFAGKSAGGMVGSYLCISIDNRNYMLHRVIFKMMTDKEPTVIDHKDGNKTNNRWDNLRDATYQQNRCNAPVSSRSLSGVKGVRQTEKGQWFGIVTLNRKAHRTDYYDTLEDAKAAVSTLRRQLHGDFAKD